MMGDNIEIRDGKIQVIYRCKTPEERERRTRRAIEAVGKIPFVHLPGNPPQHKVLWRTPEGYPVRVLDVEMVYNDMILMDYISDNGKDGPLYRDTYEGVQLEVLNYALKAYAQ